MFTTILRIIDESSDKYLKVSKNKSIQCQYVPSGDADTLKTAAHTVCKMTGRGKLIGCIRLQGANLTVVGGGDNAETDAEAAYALLDWLDKTDAGKAVVRNVTQAMKIFNDVKNLPKDQQGPAREEAKKLNAELTGILRDVKPEISEEGAAALAAAQTDRISVSFNGHYHQLQLLCAFCLFDPLDVSEKLKR